MSMFRTKIDVPRSTINLNHEKKIMLTGSCFTENMGLRLKKQKFQVDVNPFGVIYNPLSVAENLTRLIQGKPFEEMDLEYFNHLWFSFSHHGSFSASSKCECLTKINRRFEFSSAFLKRAGIIIITFGTARVYRLKKSGKIAVNCHKIPASEFDHFLLNIEEIVNTYKDLMTALYSLNPNLDVIFTISPVRHWKDGATGNQVSKSILVLAINELLKIFPAVEYFPSYELVLDDLRDYRFYNEDMLHPNSLAIDYVHEKFLKAFTSEKTRDLIKEIEKITKARQHKPFNSISSEYQLFKAKRARDIQELNRRYPYLDFEEELSFFQSTN